MKVALIGTYSGSGGIQTHLHWLSLALLKNGNEVVLISLGQKLDAGAIQKSEGLHAFGRFVLHDLAAGNNSTTRAIPNSINFFRKISPDIVIACGTGWNLFIPAIFSGSCPRRIFHEVMSGEAGNLRDSRWAARWGFHEVVAQASVVAENFRRTFRWKEPIPILPAFPEPLEITAEILDPPDRRIRDRLPRAAFFSRLVPHKRALWLTHQWPRLSQVLSELHFHGTGPEECVIRELVNSMRWNDRVFVHGRYPEGQDYVNLINDYDFTVLPTAGAEGAPLVLLESMACGIPFVSTDAGGIRDYDNDDCIIVSINDDEAFLCGVEQMSERLMRGEINHARLRGHYLSQFSFSALEVKWMNFLGLPRG